MYTSQLTSVLFVNLKLEIYFFGKEFVTIFNSTFLSKSPGLLLSKSFFMHRRRRVTYDQISAVNGLMRYNILKLHGNETGSSCDQRLPESDFESHFRSSISKITRERNHIIQGILIKK